MLALLVHLCPESPTLINQSFYVLTKDKLVRWMNLYFVEPDHSRALSNIGYFEEEFKKNPNLYNNYVDEDQRDTSPEHARYEELCRRPDPVVRLT